MELMRGASGEPKRDAAFTGRILHTVFSNQGIRQGCKL